MTQQATIIIPTKSTTNGSNGVEFPEQIIELLPKQLQQLSKASIKKTTDEWLSAKRGIKIRMTEEQKASVLDFKNAFVEALAPSRSAEDLLKSGKIGFFDHAFDRIDERFLEYYRESEEKANKLKEKLGFEITEVYHDAASTKTTKEILEIFIESDNLDDFFVWKAHPYLSYKFKGGFRNDVIGIVVTFSERTMIITITIEERH